jgi:hypothetical protein
MLAAYAMTGFDHLPLPVPSKRDTSQRHVASSNRFKQIKGSLRNLICTCGSGKKRKKCPCGGRA